MASKRLISLILAAIILQISSVSYSAENDCSEFFEGEIDYIICSDPELNQLNTQIFELSNQLENSNPAVRATQLTWLQKRDACKSNECLLGVYKSRVEEIKSYLVVNSKLPLTGSESSELETVKVENSHTQSFENKQTDIETQRLEHSDDKGNSSPSESTALQNDVSDPSKSESDNGRDSLLIKLLIIAGVIYFIFTTICPKCKKPFANKVVGEEVIRRYLGTKNVEKTDEHRDKYGQLIKTVKRTEQVKVEKADFRIFHECRKCGHAWVTKESREV